MILPGDVCSASSLGGMAHRLGVVAALAARVWWVRPEELNSGPLLWALTKKAVTTRTGDGKLCGKGLFKIEKGSLTVAWDAPHKSLDCDDIEFTSALEGMSDPHRPKGR